MTYDIAVVGGGPGGYVAALYAAQNGLRVALAERDSLGGTCLNRGCIPTKALVQSAHLYEKFKNAAAFGIRAENLAVDWPGVAAHKDAVVKKLTRGVGALLKARGVDVLRGAATVTGPESLEVETAGGVLPVRAKNIILACGSAAARLPIPGAERPEVVTSDGALSFAELPGRLTIIGGGVIGLEMAYIYRTLGADVTILEALDGLLPGWDESLTAEIGRILSALGVTLHTSARVTRFEKTEAGIETVFSVNGREQTVLSDKVLLAAGRKPVAPLCRGVAFETTDRGFLKVDDDLQTSVPGVYAIGDMNGRCMLAHAASHQAVAAVDAILGRRRPGRDDLVPGVIYMCPGIASVGLTERQARERYGEQVRIGLFPVSASGMAAAAGESRGFVKLISESRWGEILGVHIVSENACELIAEATDLITGEATVEYLTRIAHPHPSLSEMLTEAAYADLGTPIHTL